MMSRQVIIALSVVLLTAAANVMCANDDFVEDVYFWASEPVKDADGKIVPNFNPKAKEIVFLPTVQLPDTAQSAPYEQPQQQELREQINLQEQPTE